VKLGIVSLGGKSSKAVAKAAKKYFDQVDLLDIRQFEVNLANSGPSVLYNQKSLPKYDCLYIRGSTKYSLIQYAITSVLQQSTYIPFQPRTFLLGHDKFLTLLELQKNKISIPKTYYVATKEIAKKTLDKAVRYPVIIKVPDGTHGKGVLIADSTKSAKTIVDMLEVFKKPYIIQEFVKTRKTTDIRAIVVGDKVIAAYQRKAAKGEIRANTHSGGTRKPHMLTPEQEKLAIKSARAIKADICGVDILNTRRPSVIEVNLSPSVHAGINEVTGVKISREIAKYLYQQTAQVYKVESQGAFKNVLDWILKK